MKFIRFQYLIILGFSIALLLSTCYKKGETKAVIRLLRVNETPIDEIDIRLYYEDTAAGLEPRIDLMETSNPKGEATFDFTDIYKAGQAGFALLDIYVGDSIVGNVNVVPEEITRETIIL